MVASASRPGPACLAGRRAAWAAACAAVLAALALPIDAAAQEGSAAPAASGASAAPGASTTTTAPVLQPPVPIVVMNREIANLRAGVFGVAPAFRASEAENRIAMALRTGGPLRVRLERSEFGTLVQVDGASMFAITPADTSDRTAEAAHAEAARAAAVLAQVIEESRESRDLKALLTAGSVALAVTAALVGLLLGLRWLRRKVESWLVTETLVRVDRLGLGRGGLDVLRRDRVVRFERLLFTGVFWLLTLLLLYEWASITLGQFPYTRPWGERLNAFLLGLLLKFALAIAHAVPDLLAAALIFWLAWALSHALRRFFDRVATGRVVLPWLGADVARTTSRLCIAAVWLFALAMAYPYLPGSETEAFKGLSVLVGLMISLGASNLVGQLASGLILTYTRAYRAGEYVRIGEHEGTVITLGSFTTRIRTGMGEELTLSNSEALGSVTRNYSRTVKGPGFIVDTTVTIGYDAPWRQVVAMLEEAARRTGGVLADPKPQVFQVALSDFYPEYRLVCQAVPSEPRPRALVMSELHANIQDVFNEHGVQIMSPHYLGDPAEAKVVPPAKWYAAPAARPEGAGRPAEGR
jgi:small-conductance mechanosensitive channel